MSTTTSDRGSERGEFQPRNRAESLIDFKALDELETLLTEVHNVELVPALAELRRQIPKLDSISYHAVSALNGDLDAGYRLDLILDTDDSKPISSRQMLNRYATMPSDYSMRIVNDGALLQLIAGNCWSSPDSDVSDRRLVQLGRVLDLVFFVERVDYAARSKANGFNDSIRNLSALWVSFREKLQLNGTRFNTDKFIAQTTRFDLLSPSRLHPPNPSNDFEVPHLEWRGEWALWDWRCLDDTEVGMCVKPGIGTPSYHIDSISNNDACAGEIVTIRGRNFGAAGEVWFPSADLFGTESPYVGGPSDGSVAPLSWTDTEITVRVPHWATAGDLHLGCYAIRIDGCKTLYLYRSGNSFPFYGGLTKLIELRINNEDVDLTDLPDHLVVEPGAGILVQWKARGGSNTTPGNIAVAITLKSRNGELLYNHSHLPKVGVDGFFAPSVTAPTRVTLEISATGGCGSIRPVSLFIWVTVRPVVTIDWVEISQGVQENGRHTDARLPVVARKDTAIRIHFKCDRGGFWNDHAQLSGLLDFDFGVTSHPSIPALAHCVFDRTSKDDQLQTTLNFLIPAALTTAGPHPLRFKVRVLDVPDPMHFEHSANGVWLPAASMNVKALVLPYGDHDYVTTSPTAYARSALNYLPTPVDRVGTSLTMSYPSDSSRYKGKMAEAAPWQHLLNWMEDEYEDSDVPDDEYWLVIVPDDFAREGPGIDNGTSRTGGLASRPGRVACAIGSMPETGAHELGHCLGLKHIRQPKGDGEPDGPYGTATNGGFHQRPYLQVPQMTLIPLPDGDMMSYYYGNVSPQARGPVKSTWLTLFAHFSAWA